MKIIRVKNRGMDLPDGMLLLLIYLKYTDHIGLHLGWIIFIYFVLLNIGTWGERRAIQQEKEEER